jgi:NAD(P)-dependent dehydrogenase (short-subunit alcohol dehydrogenase family)
MNRLQGKRLLITGGTTGIGLETAKQFLLEGARVVITGQNPDTLAQAQQELGKDVIIIESDAGKIDEQQRLVAEIDRVFGQLDGVFLNAGIAIFQPIEQWDEAAFDRQIVVNSEARPEFEAMPTMIHLYVENADELYDRALQAGATSMMEPRDEFYGDRSAGVKDPTGNQWWIATHQEDVSSTELEERIKTLFGSPE